MAEQVLDVELKQETVLLTLFDEETRRVNALIDIRENEVTTLAIICLAGALAIC